MTSAALRWIIPLQANLARTPFTSQRKAELVLKPAW